MAEVKVSKGLLYTKEHEWIKIEGNVGVVGIADYAQEHLGDIVYVDLPEAGDEISKGDAFSSVESVKAATDVYLPMSGKIIEVNEALDDEPELLNKDAYANWIVKIELSNPSEASELMNDEAYKEFASKEN